MLNVLIVEDDSMARKLLEIYINESSDYEMVHSIESAAMAEFYCLTNKIDIILMDVCTAMDANGLEAAEKIKKSFPDIKIIIITSQPNAVLLTGQERLALTASGTKMQMPRKLFPCLTERLQGRVFIPIPHPI